MTWNPSLNVNVKKFDDQHLRLLDMVNELHDGMIAGNGNAVLGKTLDGLISYTTTHFSDEEQLMISCSYPDAITHKTEYENLVMQVLELQQKFSAGQAILSLEVLMFLRDWLMEHIHISDHYCPVNS
jgi:hemerythrin